MTGACFNSQAAAAQRKARRGERESATSERTGEDNEISLKLIKCDDGGADLNRYVNWVIAVVLNFLSRGRMESYFSFSIILNFTVFQK